MAEGILLDLNLNSIAEGVFGECENTRQQELIKHFFLKDILQVLDDFSIWEKHAKGRNISDEQIMKNLNDILEGIIVKGVAVEKELISEIAKKKLKQAFRVSLRYWLYKSNLIRHASEKPYGYPGDYEMLEYVYNDKTISSEEGYFFDRYFLSDPYRQAICNRKDMMGELLVDYICKAPGKYVRLLNLACGVCREIIEQVNNIPNDKFVKYTCVDHDAQTLAYAQQKWEAVKKDNIQIEFVRENVLQIARNADEYRKKWGTYDMVYSIGLADYLSDRVMSKLIEFAKQVLNDSGECIIAYKDRSAYNPIRLDWLYDWKFVPRDRSHIEKLTRTSAGKEYEVKLVYERSDIILFSILKRAKTIS